jgi:hypothetical protein
LHVRPGLDEEEHPDVIAALTSEEKLMRRLESQDIFAWANVMLSQCSLAVAEALSSQGTFSKVIRRIAARIGANLIVLPGDVRISAETATLTARPNRTSIPGMAPIEALHRKLAVAVEDEASIDAFKRIRRKLYAKYPSTRWTPRGNGTIP